jgi:hypothetical protein
VHVKIFKGFDPESLEGEANRFMSQLPASAVIKFTQTSAVQSTSAAATSSRTQIVLTIWYEDEGARGA